MALAERDHIRTIEDLIREMAGGLIHIHRPCEEHIPPHRDLRRILLTVVEARGERWIVQTDHRMILFLQHGNELCEIMLHTRQIHLIEADDVLLLRMRRRIDQKLGEPRIRTAVHHILHIHIAQDIPVIHP
ncbi:Uncharacterised protein [Bacteroides xylanisolvens]|nr:Uncharacterised protein [Bacteroides xylanisolvens]